MNDTFLDDLFPDKFSTSLFVGVSLATAWHFKSLGDKIHQVEKWLMYANVAAVGFFAISKVIEFYYEMQKRNATGNLGESYDHSKSTETCIISSPQIVPEPGALDLE